MMKERKKRSLAFYRDKIDGSRRWRQTDGYDRLWSRLNDLYRGRHFGAGSSDEDRIAINLAFSTLNVIFPSISVSYPKVSISPNSPENEDRAVITEAVVNYWWKHYGFHEPFRLASKDFLTFGHGWIKVSWAFEEVEEAASLEELEEEYASRVSEVDEAAALRPDLAGELPTDEEIVDGLSMTRTRVVEDRPTVERVSPFDMFVDPDATHTSDMGWVAQRIVRSVDEVREDERYVRSVRRKVKGEQASVSLASGMSQERERRHDRDLVAVWEFYDLRENTLCAFAEGSDGFLIEPQAIPYASGHPFVMVRNYDVPDFFYPIGDLEMLVDAQDELNKTRSQMMNHRKKYARKYLIRERAFGPEGREALVSNVDNITVPVIDDTPFGEVVAAMPQTPLSAELYNYTQVVEADIDKLSGVNEYARGNPGAIRRTATEAAIIQDASNARAADKLAIIERFIADVARKVLQLAQEFLTEEQVARVTGANDQIVWVPFKPDDIAGEYDFSVEAGSTQPNNEAGRRQNAAALMNALGPFVGTVIDPHVMVKHVLTEGFGIKNVAKFMIDPYTTALLTMGGDPGLAGGGPGGEPFGDDPGSAISGVPAELVAQLQGQAGLNPASLQGA